MNIASVIVAAMVAATASYCADASALSDGRSIKVERDFQKLHPCPSTGRTYGKCPGFVHDHVKPLCLGGPDTVENMQWQLLKDSWKKDAEERAACKAAKQHPAVRR